MRKFRFYYDGAWSPWFTDADDISCIEGKFVHRMEIEEEMTRSAFAEKYPDHASETAA